MSRVKSDTEKNAPSPEDATLSDPRLQLGQILKEARIAKELSYDDVVKATCIRQKIIEALEEGNFTKIGSETYIKGFIKTYANFLGLFPDTLLDLYAENPVTKKYIHPFDMAFPAPISMAPTRKLILTCGLALFFLLISFTLYDQHMSSQQNNKDLILAKFSPYIEEEAALPEAEPIEATEIIAMVQFGNPDHMLKKVSKKYKIFHGEENVMLDPAQEGWIELYQGDDLLLRTKLNAQNRYYMNRKKDQTLVVKEGDWLKASYKGQPIDLTESATCNDHYCIFPE